MKRREALFLHAIVAAIDAAREFAADALESGQFDAKSRSAVLYQLQIVGEASSKLSDETRSKRPEIPWEGIIGMRHHLAHGYHSVEMEIVWNVVRERLQPLREAVVALMRDEAG